MIFGVSNLDANEPHIIKSSIVLVSTIASRCQTFSPNPDMTHTPWAILTIYIVIQYIYVQKYRRSDEKNTRCHLQKRQKEQRDILALRELGATQVVRNIAHLCDEVTRESEFQIREGQILDMFNRKLFPFLRHGVSGGILDRRREIAVDDRGWHPGRAIPPSF